MLIQDFLAFINDVIWGSVILYLLAGAGVWFIWHTGFIQVRYASKLGKIFHSGRQNRAGALSASQTLCLSLAARTGCGNIAGVALAISTGGPGAIFWMWVAALFVTGISFAECALAQLYKERDSEGRFRGGPAWYMERGLGMRWLGILFSLLLLLAFGLVFNAMQASAISLSLTYAFNLPIGSTVAAVVVLSLAVLLTGIKRIATITQWLMPLIALLWIVIAFSVAIAHFNKLPDVLALVFTSAFGWHEAASGALGYTMSQAITSGFQRATFAGEAGAGSTPNAAAMAASSPSHPAAHGILHMLGDLFNTLIICTASAMIVLLSGVPDLTELPFDGVILMQQALKNLAGDSGPGLVAVIMTLFAFTSIAANYIYAENNLIFLRLKSSRLAAWLLRAGTLSMVMIGALFPHPFFRLLAEAIMAVMVIMNLTAILLLSPVVKMIAGDYLRQRRLREEPVFDAQRFPEIALQPNSGIWEKQSGKKQT